jgi:alkylation response protein AidB-like acyl-CoA dehydrogenase
MYGLSSESQRIVDAAGRIAREVALPAAADVDGSARFPSESIEALSNEGFLGLCVSRQENGKGEGPRTFAAVVEELAAACGSTAMIYVMHVTSAQAIASSSTLEQRDAVLREIADGKHLTTLAFSEKGSRSQFWAPVSHMEPSDGHYLTSASKSWVTAAKHAHSYVSSSQMPEASSPLESVVYLARRGSDGVAITSSFDGLGLRGNESAPMELTRLAI